MSQPLKLSVVIPSLNQAEYLELAIASLILQRNLSRDELEIIVVDGGSHDRTLSLLQSLRYSSLSWVSEPDTGQTDALIKGFDRCTGDILGWLCCDDLLEPFAAREVLETFSNHPEADFVYGDATWIDRDGRFAGAKKEIPFNRYIWLHDHNYIPQPAAFWRSQLYRRVGGLNRSFDLAMDADLFARFLEQTNPLHVRRTWARIRRHPDQKTCRFAERGAAEMRTIQARMGASVGNPLAAWSRHWSARVWRIGWKAALGAYF